MPGSDLTQWDPLLKEDYAPRIVNALNEENQMQEFMTTELVDESWTGREKVVPVKVGRNWSIGSIGPSGALPNAGRSSYVDFKIPIRDIYGRVGFERYVMEQSRNKKGSWAQVIPQEMDGMVEDLAFRRNAIAWGYGSGILALLNGAQNIAAGVALELKSAGNVGTTTTLANRYIFGDTTSGMVVSVLDATTQAVKATGTVTNVNADGTDITLDVAVNAASGDFVVIAQQATQNSYMKEPDGLLSAIDDGTYVAVYHNVSRTTYPVMKAYVVTGVGALSLDALQQPLDAVNIKVGKGIDILAMEHSVQRAYLSLLETDRRYTGADLLRPDGGTIIAKGPTKKKLTFGDIPIFADRDAPLGMIFGINKASHIRYVASEGHWAEDGGSVIKWVPGFDQYTAFWLLMENYHCNTPARNFRMEGITVNQLVVRSF